MKHLVITALLIAAPFSFGQDQELTGRTSIKGFGAKGDGIADDTAAIQTGLNAACSDNFTIAGTTGAGVSPIVVTTSVPHSFLNRSSLTVQNVGGNTNANGVWSVTVLSPTTVALYGPAGEPSTGNAAYVSGGTITAVAGSLYFPAGIYNISSPVVTECTISLSGDGPSVSVIFQTHQYLSIHGIVANHSLRMEDIAINTAPLTEDYGMIGVFAGTSAATPMIGDTFTFVRFHSSGFNFGLDINGTSDTDLLSSITVDDCNISVGTQANAVSQPINAANAVFLIVRNSTLSGNSPPGGAINNDHGIYTLAIRGVLIQNNLIQNHGNSAIKLLQGGFHSAACPTAQDYTSWTIDNNRIVGSRLAIAVYSYCALVMPSIVISNNLISNIPNAYLGDYAAVYVQSNCQSNMVNVLSSGNTFTNLGLGGIVLASQVEGDATCTAPTAQGTITSFTSTRDTFVDWSKTSEGTFPAINSTGLNLIHASVSQLNADGGLSGNVALNLAAFADVNVVEAVN